MTLSWSADAARAIRAVREGAAAVMESYRDGIRVDAKEDGSPVTEADINSNDAIKGALRQSGYPVLSEEDSDSGERVGAERVWVVDPLDGTADFIDRTGEFTVMVALVRRGRPVAGAICRPQTGIVYAAEEGAGAWECHSGRWRAMAVSDVSRPEKMRVLVSRNHLTPAESGFVESLRPASVETLGSSLKATSIGGGGAELYVTFTDRMKEWDTAASCCILHEAGGRMTDLGGNDFAYNREDVFHRNGILASNGRLHRMVVESYADYIKPRDFRKPTT